MSVTVKVNGVSNSLVHKGSNCISAATIPDVCKTPSPGGPVPIPYPNISQSSTLSKGSTTVKADGGMMIAIKGSEFSISNGDNAGTLGGVKSNTFMKESTWILYSFDVKIDGQNACRLTDKKFQNHENTVDLGGAVQYPVIPAGLTAEQMVACAIYCCDIAKYNKRPKTNKGKFCRSLSTSKHSCVMHALRNSKDAKKVRIKASERRYLNKRQTKFLIPDVKFGNRIIDAKFPCNKAGMKPGRKMRLKRQPWASDMNKTSEDMLTRKEKVLYKKLARSVRAMTPRDAKKKKTRKCKCAEYKPM